MPVCDHHCHLLFHLSASCGKICKRDPETLQLQESLETAQGPNCKVEPSERGGETARHAHRNAESKEAIASIRIHQRGFAWRNRYISYGPQPVSSFVPPLPIKLAVEAVVSLIDKKKSVTIEECGQQVKEGSPSP